MKIEQVSAWKCGECGYVQDIEPTKANQALVFNNDPKFRLSDIDAGECPSCALRGVRGSTLDPDIDSVKESFIADDSDVLEYRQVLEQSSGGGVPSGVIEREETPEELTARALKEATDILGEGATRADIQAVAARIESMGASIIKEVRYRETTPEEDAMEIERALARVVKKTV